ncbi:putative TIM-barrel fold metal-dependent hydrolase [Pseudomonas sp. GM33]|uniref:amidohydrolase family protein n=1 Tax=Pseudomonas sp. GM33 TaxID=1144329 RepID=UPI00026FF1EB|nr:amidohydrolase family protein [Pseudomonas sp. GM33]EJM34489.1 putative TIM-barrel fold metal-dependent hydrolase [Pseudomonas sp. GM33]
MYMGPVVDAFFHPAWTDTPGSKFANTSAWLEDPMRARAMQTFKKSLPEHVGASDLQGSAEERMLRDMDESRVEKALLQASLYYPSTREALDNCVLEHVELIEKYPARFAHCATVLPPRQGPASYWDLMENPRILEEYHERYSIKGVHLLPAPWGTPPNDKWYYPLFSKCVELGLVVFIYVGIPGPLWPTYPNYPLHLDDVCLAFPDLVVVAHHIGDPWVEMMTHLSGKHANLYIATSGWAPKRYPEELIKFMAGKWHGQKGADKVIFGTDHPFLNLKKTVEDARCLALPDEVIEKFMYQNIKKLIPSL